MAERRDISLIPSFVALNMRDGESKWVACGGNSFPITRHGGEVYTSRGHVVSVLKDHDLTMEGNAMIALRGTYRIACPEDVVARYDRRWFITSIDEVRHLYGIATADCMAQYAWRASCGAMAATVDSIQNQVDIRMMLFPALDIDVEFNVRKTLDISERVARREAFFVYVRSEERSMMMLGMPVHVSLSRSMACFSACIESLTSSSNCISVPGLVDNDFGCTVQRNIDFPAFLGPSVLRCDYALEEACDTFETSWIPGDIGLYTGCVCCSYKILGFYNYNNRSFRFAPGKCLKYACNECSVSCCFSRLSLGKVSVYDDVVSQITRWLVAYLITVGCRPGTVCLLTGVGDKLCVMVSCIPRVPVIVRRNGLRGIRNSYDYYRKYTCGLGIGNQLFTSLGTIGVTFCTVVYHKLFSIGRVNTIGLCTDIWFVDGSDYVRSVIRAGIIRSRNGRVGYNEGSDCVLVRVNSLGQVIDTEWAEIWALSAKDYFSNGVKFYLMFVEGSGFVGLPDCSVA